MQWFQDKNQTELKSAIDAVLSKRTAPMSTTHLMHAMGCTKPMMKALTQALAQFREANPTYVEMHEGVGAFGKTAYYWRMPK